MAVAYAVSVKHSELAAECGMRSGRPRLRFSIAG